MTHELDARLALAILDAMVPVLEASKKTEAVLRRKFGTAFRIAEYAVGGYEVPLNRIIADLLDPRGPHGQGGTFLNLFVEAVVNGLPIGDSEKWLVVAGHLTRHKRRVDLVLFRHPDIAIYIECKPWAAEGYQQLDHYADDLLAQQHKNKRLLFLPGFDRDPVTLTARMKERLGNGNFSIVPFQRSGRGPSIVQWLERCREACSADNVRLFISDLAEYLDSEFPSEAGVKSMSDDTFIRSMMSPVRKNKSYMEIVFRCEQMAPQLRRAIAESFIQDLSRELEKLKPGWLVEHDFRSFDKQEALFFRKGSWPKGWAICMEGQSKFMDYCIGYCCPSKPEHRQWYEAPSNAPLATDEHRAIIRGALETPLLAIGNGVRDSESWPAYCWLPAPLQDWNSEAFSLLTGLEQMPDGRTALRTFVDWFELLSDALGNKIDDILTELGSLRGPLS